MQTKKVVIPYFPIGLKYCTPLILLGGGVLLVDGHYMWAIICLLASGIILTTRYITEIDLGNRLYRDCLSLLWIEFGVESNRFQSLDKITITKGNYAQNVQTRVQSRQYQWADYTATLVMDGDKTLDLLTRNDKALLLRELKPFSEFLQVDVEDHTVREPYWVDMAKVV